MFVIRRVDRGIVPTYKVDEFDGTPLEGTFYEQELQRVTVDDESLWRIEKVLKRQGERLLGLDSSKRRGIRMSTDFYVTLRSTAGGKEFAENTANHFKVRLPHPLCFPGRGWKVGLTSISLSDPRTNVHAIVTESAYLVSARWAVQQGRSLVMDGAHIKMDHIDDLDSVVESRLCVLVSIPSKPKERVLSKRVTNGRLPRVNTCT